jgi:putative oxidoreductase
MKTLTRIRGSAIDMNVALLILRLVCGGFLMGHGGQKLFGWFKGPGMQGTGTWLEGLGMRPGRFWAALAGGSEFGGGLLMVLGFLNPLGPLAAFGAMSMATVKAHLGRPIWAAQGGPELAITNMAISSTVMVAGPGDYSVDTLLGSRLPRWVLIPGLLGVAGTVAYAHYGKRFPQVQQQVTQVLQTAQQTVEQTVQRATPAIQTARATLTNAATQVRTATGATTGATTTAGANGRATQPTGTR